jgi:hypothetical protein
MPQRAAAPYHNPRYIEVVAAFERTPSQRIAKQALSRDTAGSGTDQRGDDDDLQRQGGR